MAKYHVVPSTGAPAKCRATLRPCPYGPTHYPTAGDAWAAHEASQANLLATFRSQNPDVPDPHLTGAYSPVTREDRAQFPSVRAPRRRASTSLDLEEAYLKWEATLPVDQQHAIHAYRGGDSRPINNAFRYGDGIPYLEDDLTLDGKLRRADVVHHLDALIHRYGTPTSELLYHGLTMPGVEDWSKLLLPGAHLRFRNFLSTSITPRNAEPFARPDGIIFEMRSPNGLFLDTFEEEKLLPRDTVWKVVDRTTITYGDRSAPVVQLLRME